MNNTLIYNYLESDSISKYRKGIQFSEKKRRKIQRGPRFRLHTTKLRKWIHDYNRVCIRGGRCAWNNASAGKPSPHLDAGVLRSSTVRLKLASMGTGINATIGQSLKLNNSTRPCGLNVTRQTRRIVLAFHSPERDIYPRYTQCDAQLPSSDPRTF